MFLTVKDVAKTLRVDVTTVRRWIKDGVIDAVTLPSYGRKRSYRINKKVIESLLGG